VGRNKSPSKNSLKKDLVNAHQVLSPVGVGRRKKVREKPLNEGEKKY
jgi:hypothetical protein